MIHKKPLTMEKLERRELFAVFNIPWPEIDQLSLSFVPDGTQVGNQTSELYRSLDRIFRNSDWQIEVLRAFQTWAVETKANIALTDDGGQPIGTLGFKQGDVRFGDVRIGAFPMDEDVLAVANPYDPFIANSWVGDVFLNANSHFLEAAENPADALYTIMLHEAGHVFGIGHSLDPASPTYPRFESGGRNLTEEDLFRIHTLYGSRAADSWEGDLGNETVEFASVVPFYGADGNLLSPSWRADVRSNTDVDLFAIQVPADIHFLDVRLKAKGISLLTAKLSIEDESGKPIGSARAVDPRQNDLSLSLSDVNPGEIYYLRVEAGSEAVFGMGAYEIDLFPRQQAAGLAPDQVVPEVDDHSVVDSQGNLVTTPGYIEHTYYEVEGMLSAARPSRTYRVRSADVASDLANIFTVVVGVENASIDELDVNLSDIDGRKVPFELIPNTQGTLAFQVGNVRSATDYLIEVSVKGTPAKNIHFEVEVDFAHDGGHLQTIVNESLDSNQPVLSQDFRVDQSQQFHFALATSDWSDPNESGLEMQIIDASGNVVYVTQARDGATQTFDVFLSRDDYVLRFSSPGRSGASRIIFQLSGITTSSPIGPQLRDTVREPVESRLATPIASLTNFWLPGFASISPSVANFTTDSFDSAVKVNSRVMVQPLQLRSQSTARFMEFASAPVFEDVDPKSPSSLLQPSQRTSPKSQSIPNSNRPEVSQSETTESERVEQAAFLELPSNGQPSDSNSTQQRAQDGDTAPATKTDRDTSAHRKNLDADASSSTSLSELLKKLDQRQINVISAFALLLGGIVIGKRNRFAPVHSALRSNPKHWRGIQYGKDRE